MIKICYGLLISSKEKQVMRLIDSLNVNDNILLILVDKKSESIYQTLKNYYINEKNIHFIYERFDVQWGGITTSVAVHSLLKFSLQFKYDYFTLMSESCLPLYHDLQIKKFLQEHQGTEFIDVRFDWTKRSRLHLYHEPYTNKQRKHRNFLACRDVFVDTLFGWAMKNNPRFKSFKVPTTLLWFTITKECVGYAVETTEKEQLLKKYDKTLCGDEHILAEIIYKSPYYDRLFCKKKRGAALLYCDWYVLNAPRLLKMRDYKKMYHAKLPCLYARKFDMMNEGDVVEKIYQNRNDETFEVIDCRKKKT